MKQKVVIIGVSYSSRLALARSIGKYGYDITVVAWDTSKPIDGYSKYVNRVLLCQKEEKTFVRLLMEKCADVSQKVILIPDCDFSVSIIDLHQDELKPFFLFPHINHQQGAIVGWSDKSRQKQLAAKLGMTIADSTIIEIKDGAFTIPDIIKYPCFPKALASVSGGKAGMFRCENVADLERALHDIIKKKTANAKVMVEDYIEIEKEYAVLGFSDGKNVTIPAVIQFVVGSKTQKGIALQGEIIPTTGFEEITEKFKTLVRKVGLVGLFDIDFYKSGEELYFSELNIRYGGSGYAVVKMGVNLPLMLVDFLSGKKVEGMNKQVEKEAVFTNERMCYNDLQNGLISIKEYRHYIDCADILFLEDKQDPRPFRMYRRSMWKAIIRYMLKKTGILKK